MSTTSPSSHNTPLTPEDEIATAGPNNDQYRVVRKRNRVPLSCAACRMRKLKCNRSTPCENCVKRGEPDGCSYTAPPVRRRTTTRSIPAGKADDMQNRIDKLEGLVLSLMSSGSDPIPRADVNRTMSMSTRSNSQSALTPQSFEDTNRDDESMDSKTDRVTKSFGVLHFNNSQSAYIGDSHWATILHEISEVKNYFKDHAEQYEEVLNTVEASRKARGITKSGPAFLLAGRSPPDIKELVTRLPRRVEIDPLVERYFNDYDPGMSVLHIPSWRRRYDAYWKNPNNTDIPFLAQLYAICGLAMQSYFKNFDEPLEYQGKTQSLAQMYRSLSQQCLQLVDYARPESTTIETLILNLHAEYQRSGEADIGTWVLSRTVISLAMRTGLHRDATNFPGITPFRCELRRRQWAFLRLVDTMWSYTVGLPTMIKVEDTDTKMPSNLKDEDFDEDTITMPASRPRTELTDVSYLIAKAEIVEVFSRIISTITGTGTTTYDEIVKLNDEIRSLYHGTFPALHLRSDEEFSRIGSETLTIMRLGLSITYNKSLCVLHRRHLTLARGNSKFNLSRQACIDAALTLMRNQQTIDRASKSGSRVFLRLISTSTIMTHAFILAATLTALDLLGSVQAEAAGRDSGDIEVWGVDRKEEQLKALEGARAIWGDFKDQFVEAYKAYSICGVMLQKIRQYLQPKKDVALCLESKNLAAGLPGEIPNQGAMVNGALQPPVFPGAIPNGQFLGSTGLTPNLAMDSSLAGSHAFPFFDGVGAEMSANMDWNAWDEYMQNPDLPMNGDTWPQGFDLNMMSVPDSTQLTNGVNAEQILQLD